jgi:mannose-6-phosphate isomerase-like protein (cupin superfamily)
MRITMLRMTCALVLAGMLWTARAQGDDDYKVVTIIKDDVLLQAMQDAPADGISDQPIRHVVSAEGNLGIGVVHRPTIEKGGPIAAIQHLNQSEVYRVMAGAGTLVTSAAMVDNRSLDADGYVVQNLTGPSDVGTINSPAHSQLIQAGDIVIIPAGVAHGFSEITEAITYMVVRVDPDELVALK